MLSIAPMGIMNNVAEKLALFTFVLAVAVVFVRPLPSMDERQIDSIVRDTTRAETPRVLDTHVLLTYETPVPRRYVGARFDDEQYSILHLYVRNEHGVFILLRPIPEQTATLRYRIVIDGLWREDPFNPLSAVDEQGIKFSILEFPPKPQQKIAAPTVEPTGRVTLSFAGAPGKAITVAGSFNNWDPFTHRLREREPGVYETTLRLLPGRYYYVFVVDGQKNIDPFNEQTAVDPDGNTVSTLYVPQRS